MDSLLSYLVRMLLVSGLLTGYYLLVLRDRRMHGFNRLYLLGSVVLALVLPVLRIGWNPFSGSHGEIVQRVLLGTNPAGAAGGGIIAVWIILLGSCGLVSAVLLSVSAVKIMRLYRIKRRSLCRQMDGYALVETDAPGTPFSFLRNLFWRNGTDTEDIVNRKMLAHELAHIRGRHSWDILGMQLVLCVFWMNPFFWFIRRELTMVLEYIADAASGAEGDPEGFARMLLKAWNDGRQPDLATGFFHSPIKRRLTMITINNRRRRNWVRMAIALPVLATAVIFFSCSKTQPAEKVQSITMKLDKVDQVKLQKDAAEKKFIASAKFKKLRLTFKKGNFEIKSMQDSIVRVYFVANPAEAGTK